MNIEIANRLVSLRKKNGLSQEELANKLGLSRQAVSKWERAEASPDTDNLICLAKLYGISLDELLKTDDGIETVVEEQIKDDESNDDITPNDEEIHKSKNILSIVEGCVLASLLLIVTVLYVTLGCLYDGIWPYPLVWPIGWIGYLSIPLATCIFETIKKKSFSSFTGAIVFLSVIAYMILGLVFNLWHPGWVTFLAIPLYAILAEAIDKVIKNKQETDEKPIDNE